MAKNINQKEIHDGDVVQVNPEKYPEFAWNYYIVESIQTHKIDTVSIKAYQLSAKQLDDSKKAKKKKKKLDALLAEKLFHINDLYLEVQKEDIESRPGG